MKITLLLRIAPGVFPYRTFEPEECEQIRQLVREELVMGYLAAADAGGEGEVGTVLSITPDGRALMAIRQAELDRRKATGFC